MGGLTYLFGAAFNAFLAGLAAIIVGALVRLFWPKRDRVDRRPGKLGLAAGVLTWFLVFGYGCVQMFVPHSNELNPQEALATIGISAPGAIPVKAERSTHGDTAQTYVLIDTDQASVDGILQAHPKLVPMNFDAHTAKERGWLVPDWWPKSVCQEGKTYQDDPFPRDDTSAPTSFVLNWCPRERKLFIQNIDY